MDVVYDWKVLAKDGADGCDDAVAAAPAREGVPFRCAVADGASESSFSGLWAELLVRAHAAGCLRARRFREDLLPLRAEWRRQVSARPLPWYAEAKVAEGAFAAFVGLAVGVRAARPWWQATALGDSCLFHVRADRLLCAFPVTTSRAFRRRPVLLATNPRGHEAGIRRTGGTWEVDDVFLLMTDALAAWFLQAHERGANPWREVLDLDTRDGPSFREWVASLRAQRALRNDDVALIRAQVADGT